MRLLALRHSLPVGFIILLSLFGCSLPNKKIANDLCDGLQNQCIRNNLIVEMLTSKGKIILELNGESAPLTTTNFIKLTKKGFYRNTSFNRVIKHPFPFIVQGGYQSSNYKTIQNIEEKDRIYLKDRLLTSVKIPLEIKIKGEDHPRYNKIISNNEDFNRIKLPHRRGSLAMSRAKPLDSASIQFYIALKDLPELDGRYAVFGKVIKGMDIVELIKEGDTIVDIKIVSD